MSSDAPTPWYDQAPPDYVEVAQPLVVRGVEERARPEGRVGAYDADGLRSLEHGEPSSSDAAAARLAFHDEESWRAWYRKHDQPGFGWNEEGEWTRYHQPAPEGG